jgi:hypothetical protein
MSIKKKEAEIKAKEILKEILKDKSCVSTFLKGLTAKQDSERYPNAIAAELLSENNPEMLYQNWDFFADLLKSKNAYHRSIAVIVISNLTIADEDNKFEEIFEDFFRLLDDNSVIVTRKLAINIDKIIKAKPKLMEQIKTKLLEIDGTNHSPSRKDLIKGDIIESLSVFYDKIENKKEILNFVRDQLSSSSPSTVKQAKNFLSKWVEK